jgi:hypothetical protein
MQNVAVFLQNADAAIQEYPGLDGIIKLYNL